MSYDRYFWLTVVSCPPRSKSCRCWNYNHSYSLVMLLHHIFFFSIRFSIIKFCGYWNSQTLDRTLTMQTNFTKKNLMAITIHWLSTISQLGRLEKHSISWKPLRFASWFPALISCSPNLPRDYIRLCKHGNNFTFLQ